MSRVLLPKDLSVIKALLDAGFTRGKIAELYGCTRQAVGSYIQRLAPEYAEKRVTKLPAKDVAAIKALLNEGNLQKEIATMYGCSEELVSKFCKLHGLLRPRPEKVPPKPKRDRPRHHRDQIVALAGQGHTVPSIAKTLGFSASAVRSYCQRQEIPVVEGARGRIPDHDREKVANLIQGEGLMQKEVGEIYGCSQHTVSRFCVRHGIATTNGRGRRKREG